MKPKVLFSLIHINKPKDSLSPHINPCIKKVEITFNDARRPEQHWLHVNYSTALVAQATSFT